MDHARRAESLATDSGLPAESPTEFPASRPLAVRLVDALRRRSASAWRRWTIGAPPPAIETAFDWLATQGANRKRGRPRPVPGSRSGLAGAGKQCGLDADSPSCAEIGAALVVAADYGAAELVARWRAALMRRQRADGGFPRPGRTTLSLRCTGYALRGLLAAEDVRPSPESLAALASAAGALLARLASSEDPPAAAIECLPPLRAASALCGMASGERVVADTLRRLRRGSDSARWDCPLEDYAARLDALWELRNLGDEATTSRLLDQALALPAALQRRDGGVPDGPTGSHGCVAGTARLALLWLRVGERDRAGRALDFVAARVPRLCQPCGVESLLRRRRGGSSGPATIWTAIWFLLATRLRVAAAFDGEAASPAAIHPADGRWLAVGSALGDLPAGALVADVGCGSGRYLHRIRERFPALRLVGIDPSAAVLASVTPGIETRRGDLLRLPARDGEFDAALCVEALEHALLPRRAVAELCRVVRPGGRIVVIDKDAALQSLSHHQPWERWFAPDEVCRWLAQHGALPTARHIPHGVPPRDPRLFVAWLGVRSEVAMRVA